MRLAALNYSFDAIPPAKPIRLSGAVPGTYFYVRVYVEIRIAEAGRFVENRGLRNHRMRLNLNGA